MFAAAILPAVFAPNTLAFTFVLLIASSLNFLIRRPGLTAAAPAGAGKPEYARKAA